MILKIVYEVGKREKGLENNFIIESDFFDIISYDTTTGVSPDYDTILNAYDNKDRTHKYFVCVNNKRISFEKAFLMNSDGKTIHKFD